MSDCWCGHIEESHRDVGSDEDSWCSWESGDGESCNCYGFMSPGDMSQLTSDRDAARAETKRYRAALADLADFVASAALYQDRPGAMAEHEAAAARAYAVLADTEEAQR